MGGTTMSDTTRQNKVAREIQKEIAEILLYKGKEYAPGKMITVTKVRVSPDLSFARLYISIFPSDKSEETLLSLQSQSSKIRYELGCKIKKQFRIVPEIAFFLDDSLDYIDNIDKLLNN